MDHFEHPDVGSTVSHHNMDHNMPGMEDKCSMNMLFTWDWKNTCIVFKWWHVKTEIGFVYHSLQLYYWAHYTSSSKHGSVNGKGMNWQHWVLQCFNDNTGKTIQNQKGVLYGFQVIYSFWLMLVFMTYNGWYMLAVGVGAGLGNCIWGVPANPAHLEAYHVINVISQ